MPSLSVCCCGGGVDSIDAMLQLKDRPSVLRLDGHLLLVRDAYVLPEAVFVLEILIAEITFARRLGRVLGANMSPKIHRGNDHFAKLTFSPFTIG